MLTLLALAATPVMAATQEECLSLWKTADVNANGT
jgi:hydroxyethylthiazole kinase-like sugar kinase family protein